MIRKTRYFFLIALIVALALASALGAPIQTTYAAAPDVKITLGGATPLTWDEAGSSNSFVLHVQNIGPDPTPGAVTITADLSGVAGITYSSYVPNGSGFVCAPGTNISCTNAGPLPAGYDQTFTISVNVATGASNSGSILLKVNPAVVGDPDNTNDQVSQGYIINKKPNLTFNKLIHKGDNTNPGTDFHTSTNGQIIAGVQNAGDGPTTGTVFVNITLPAGFTYVSTPSAGWTCGGTPVTNCSTNSVFNPGDIVDLTLVVTPPAAPAAGLSDSAAEPTGSGGEPTSYNGNNTITENGINVIGSPHISVVKSHVTNPFMEGTTGTSAGPSGAYYRFVVTNDGSGPTSGTVTLTDVLPGGLTYGGNFNDPGGFFTCSGTTTVTCTNNHVFAPSAFETLDIAVTVPYTGAPQASFTNHVSVCGGGSTCDGTNTNVVDSSGLTNVSYSALTITKSHTDPFFAGFPLLLPKYTVVLTNNGPAATTPTTVNTIVITDTLPVGIQYDSGTGITPTTDFSCVFSSFSPPTQQTVTCSSKNTVSVAGGGGTLTFDIPIIVDKSAPAAPGPNHILVHAPTTGSPDSTFNDPTTVRRADLSVTKTVSAPCTSGSSNCSFAVTVSNVGTAKLPLGTLVTVTDNLPANILFVPAGSGGTGWACGHTGTNPDVVTCTNTLAADLPGSGETPPPAPNANKMAVITLNVNPASAANNVVNTVAVAENKNIDNNTGNDTFPLTFSVGQPPFADIEVFKQAQLNGNPTTAFTRGAWVVATHAQDYHIQIRDLSGVTALANSVDIQDVLPVGMTLGSPGVLGIRASGTDNGGAAATLWTCILSGGATLDCTNTGGSIVPGHVYTFDIPVDVGLTAANPTSNTARYLPGDGNPANDFFTISTAINATPTPDLTISKSHTGNFLSASTGNQYTITVNNIGAQATDITKTITVTDTLPPGFIGTAGGGGTWSCATTTFPTAPGGTVTCTNLLALPATTGSDSNLIITVTAPTLPAPPPTFQNFTNNVSVATTEAESSTSNNTGSDPTTVSQTNVPDLSIAKTHTDPCIVNQDCTFHITVTNIGTGTFSGNVQVRDTLPAGFVYQSGGGANSWSACSPVGQQITCTNTTSTLAGGGTALGDLVIIAKPSTVSVPGVNNSVTILNVFADPSPANNSANDLVHVNGAGDLQITKVATQSFQFSQPGSYTITVKNIGTAPVTGTTTVTDTLAAGLTFTSGSGSSFACTAIAQAVTCTRFVDFAIGETATITLNVNVGAPFTVTNPVSNTAVVSNATDTDAYSGANTSTTSTPISAGPAPDLTLPSKTHAGNLVPNQNTTYSIVVRNAGAASEGGTITVTDTLDANLTYVSGSSAGGFGCAPSGQLITCTRSGLPASTSDTINLTVTVKSTATIGSTITNQAHVVGSLGDEAGTSNNDSPIDSAVVTNAPSVDATQSTVCAAPSSGLTANNIAATSVTVTVKDGTGTALVGKSVQLNISPSSGATTSSANPGTTNGSGQAVFSVTASVANTYNFTAVVDAITIGPSPCGSSATFTATAAAGVNVTNSSVTAFPTSGLALGASSLISVHIADGTNTGINGVGVTLTYTTNTGNTTGISPASGSTATTSGGGNATFTMTSSTNQTVTITISGIYLGNPFTLTQHPVITWGNGGVTTTVATSTFVTDYISIPADLTTFATLTATLKDASGNGVSGKTISVAGNPVLAGVTISPASVVTDSNGQAKFTVRSSQQGGPVTFTATNQTDGNTALSQTVQITFTAPGTKPVLATNPTLVPGTPSGAIVIARLLCIRTGPGFGYARYPSALKFGTPVTVLGKTTRVPGLAVRDNCIHIGGPTWFLMRIPGGGIVWGNANYVRVGRIAFRNLPVLPAPPVPGAPGAGQAAINGPVTSQPSGNPTATPHP